MNYSLFILPRAQKELAQLNASTFARVRDAIRELANDPRPPGCLKLTGRDGWRPGWESFESSTRLMMGSGLSQC